MITSISYTYRKLLETMKVYTIVMLALASLSTATKEKRQTPSQNLLWVNSTSALRFLTQEMSDMDNFKSSILSPMMIERVSGTDKNKVVQEHIKSFFKSWHIEQDTFRDTTPYGEKEFTNIIATFDPSKPVKVVLACHFDSKYMASETFVGATDSAVPCGILLETSRQLQCLLEKGAINDSFANNITLQLILFDGEEAFKDWTSTDSLYGARHLARKWSLEPDPVDSSITKLEAIRYFILLDLIGTTDTIIHQMHSSTSDLYQYLVEREQYLEAHNYLVRGYPGPIFSAENLLTTGGVEDDHLPFVQKGVSVLHIISTPFPSVWHQPSDDWDHLDFNLIDDFSRIFRVFVSDLLHLQPENRGCRKK